MKRKTTSIETDVLYRAVADYVESVGGTVIVVGGIQCQQWPGDEPYQFTIAIKCTGRKPEFAKSGAIS